MSATQALSGPQISRINFEHASTNSSADPFLCRLYFTSPPRKEVNERPNPEILLNHGAWTQLDNPALDAFAEGLAATHTVLTFVDKGSVEHRAATFNSLLNDYPSVTSFGGRSKGSVAAVTAAADSKVKKLILFSHPLSEKLGEPGRDEHQLLRELHRLPEDIDLLFVNGDRDELCLNDDLAKSRKVTKGNSWWIRIDGVDHSMSLELEKKRSVSKFAGEIAGKWLRGDVSAFSKKTADVLVSWDKSGKEYSTCED